MIHFIIDRESKRQVWGKIDSRKPHLESYFLEFLSFLSLMITTYPPKSIFHRGELASQSCISQKEKRIRAFIFRNNSRKVVLTAQFGSSATIVGERPRYIPLKPSVLNMSFRLVTMMLPECPPKRKTQITTAINKHSNSQNSSYN